MGEGYAVHVHPQQAGEEGQRQEHQRHYRYDQRLPVHLLGAQVRQLFMRQRRSFPHRLQFLGHARAAVRRFLQMQPVVGMQPGRVRRRQSFQRLPLRRDEAAVADRRGPDFRYLPPYFSRAAVAQAAFDLIQIIAKLRDFRVERFGDFLCEGGDEVARIADFPGKHPLHHRLHRRERAVADGDHARMFGPQADRHQRIAACLIVRPQAAQVDERAMPHQCAARPRLLRQQCRQRRLRHMVAAGDDAVRILTPAIHMDPAESRMIRLRAKLVERDFARSVAIIDEHPAHRGISSHSDSPSPGASGGASAGMRTASARARSRIAGGTRDS